MMVSGSGSQSAGSVTVDATQLAPGHAPAALRRQECTHLALASLCKPSSAMIPRNVVPRRCVRAMSASIRLTLRASSCWSRA